MTHNQRQGVLCSNCRKLINRDETICPYCGIFHPGSKWNIHRLSNLFSQSETLIKTIIYTNILMFALTLLFPPTFSLLGHGPFSILSPNSMTLGKWGATGTYAASGLHGYGSFISAYFLHGGLLHILFNMLIFSWLGSWVGKEFGGHRMFTIYTVSGIIGFFVSYIAGIPLTIGASGANCGLMGAMIYYGINRGGTYGQMLLQYFVGYTIYLVFIGIFMSGINNWAHGGGLVAGFLTAQISGYEERGRERHSHKIVAYALALTTLLTLIRAIILGFYYLLAT